MLFMIYVFGHVHSRVWHNRYEAYLAKTGISILTCGATLNILTLSTPNITEIILNVGLACTFAWIAWWQYNNMRKR